MAGTLNGDHPTEGYASIRDFFVKQLGAEM